MQSWVGQKIIFKSSDWSWNFHLHNLQFGFQKYLMYSLFIAYENDQWCGFVVRTPIGSPSLVSFYCVYFVSIFVFLPVLLLAEVLREVWRYLKWSSGVAPKFLSEVSRGELLQLHLVINVTGVMEPTEPGSVWEKV